MKQSEQLTADIKRALEDIHKDRVNAAPKLQRKPWECKKQGHDFTTSDTCRRCGYEEPFVYERGQP